MPLFNFTNEDMAILREVVSREKSRKQNRDIVDSDGELRSKPDIFVAYPVDTITALTEAVGTANEDYDLPGYGDANIYKRIGGFLVPAGFQEKIYNLTATEYTNEGGPIGVKRDKYGDFWVDAGGGCADRNEIWIITIIGKPTSGSFGLSLTINGVTETITLQYNSSASAAQTAFEAHTELASGDVTVSGGAFPNTGLKVEFTGDQAGIDIPIPVCNSTSLAGGSGVGIIVAVDQQGHPN